MKETLEDRGSLHMKDFKVQKGKNEFSNLKSQVSLRTTKNRNGNPLSTVPEADTMPKY